MEGLWPSPGLLWVLCSAGLHWPLWVPAPGASLPFPPFQGVFPPQSQVLNSPGKASHILWAGVQVYLRRGKCYYGNYNSFTKQSVAVSIQDRKNAHQLNSFLLGAFQVTTETGRHRGMGVGPSNWVTPHSAPCPRDEWQSPSRRPQGTPPLPAPACIPEQDCSLGFPFSKVEPQWWWWWWCVCLQVASREEKPGAPPSTHPIPHPQPDSSTNTVVILRPSSKASVEGLWLGPW